jgi:uncharacterized protein
MDRDRFRELLLTEHTWPARYVFKFIVPARAVAEVHALFPAGAGRERPSSGGKYVSVTAEIVMNTPDDVIAIYERAAKIEGVVAL